MSPIRFTLLHVGLLIAGFGSAVHAEVRVAPSEFRPDVTVEFLYNQDIEGVYSTTWLGREEKREGNWRDIYFETSEKYVAKGILSFQCFADDTNGDPTIGIVEYGWGEFGDPAAKRVTTIDYSQRQAWMNGELDALMGESPPYELFVVAHYRFCGDEREAAN
ncbi:hypothetical protein AAG614_04955 [Citromicrobium bathyomarinum]|uniref:hypothetical protein n=1 Tax=Citromicrobium bathyomarinum TaxID=72174 RepID=UPI001E35E91C|nr:hypothetical protein [Citromicrobium bathyomarinum]MCD1621431.1 hypothetical protein [Citromicrobium bathyomarinum]